MLSGMPYTMNPYLPRVRAEAVRLIHERGWGVRQTARYIGVHPGTVSKWLQKAPLSLGPVHEIPTCSSRPHHSPRATPREVVERIRALRLAHGRCSEVLHAQLQREHVLVSLPTVKRVLAREGLLKKRSPWKHWHVSGERPKAQKPGDLVQVDSIHLGQDRRLYLVCLLDCFSRWAFVRAVPRLNAPAAVSVVERARNDSPFSFACIQTDHGPEFSTHFTRRLSVWQIRHRHIRVRKPNDNAQVERFNRTIQEEMQADLLRYREDPVRLNLALESYLTYYNTERLHLGLNCQTPAEVFPRS